MHAARLLSQKRKHRLEQSRRSRLHRGFPNGDLSISEDESPWYVDKWDERRRAFASAKNAKGISLFHMFAIITFLGVVFMVVSLFATVPGLLEIGVTAFFFSLFCLIFVRCDNGKDSRDELVDEEPLDDIVIETQADDPSSKQISTNPSDSSENVDESQRDQIKSILIRSNPRRIPSPCHIPYGPNFSPIAEVSEPSSCASSFLTRSYEVSRLAKSQTNDSFGKPSSPIEEEEEMTRDDDPNDPDDPRISFSSNNSFDTEEDSLAADASVMTVIEREGFISDPGSSEGQGSSNMDSQFTVDELVQ